MCIITIIYNDARTEMKLSLNNLYNKLAQNHHSSNLAVVINVNVRFPLGEAVKGSNAMNESSSTYPAALSCSHRLPVYPSEHLQSTSLPNA